MKRNHFRENLNPAERVAGGTGCADKMMRADPKRSTVKPGGARQRNDVRFMVTMLLFVLATVVTAAQGAVADDPEVSDVFSGSSPCNPELLGLLGVPADPEPDLMQWKLSLYRDGKTAEPIRYRLRCVYGSAGANVPGIAGGRKILERNGRVGILTGIPGDSGAVVYELGGSVSLIRIDENLLHVLAPDGNPMVGNSGWSFTLNRDDRSEKRIDPISALNQPDMSYEISRRSTGPAVAGIFEGRTPALGIARLLGVQVHQSVSKAKWRVTLYRDPGTSAPSTYKAEGSLFRNDARTGTWSVVRGVPQNPEAVVYRLDSDRGEPTLFLLKTGENVVFFLDGNLNPMVGNADFSYTLNKVTVTAE